MPFRLQKISFDGFNRGYCHSGFILGVGVGVILAEADVQAPTAPLNLKQKILKETQLRCRGGSTDENGVADIISTDDRNL
jgi:hypothetical protein